MNHVMIDLETLGTAVDSAIVSIGAVCFELETGNLGDTFYQVLDLESNRLAGRVIYPTTVQWWMLQSEEARAVFNAKWISNLKDSLKEFTSWYEVWAQGATVWANGPSFDIAILEHAYAAAGLQVPWKFYNTRCVRTYRDLPGAALVDRPPFKGAAHNALADAVNQAEHVSAIHKALFCKPSTGE